MAYAPLLLVCMSVLAWKAVTGTNPCGSYPCLNDGVCTDNHGMGYTCECATGYSGHNCLEGGSINVSESAGTRNGSRERNHQILYSKGLRPLNHFKFSLKAERDALLMLNASGISRDYYYIYLGVQDGSRNAIMHDNTFNDVDIPDTLNGNEYRKFWISWNNKTIYVGRGDIVGSDVFMTFTEEPKLMDIQGVTYETESDVNADWNFPIGLNECDVNPCDSDSICADGIFNYTCRTTTCGSYPCLNDGVCTDNPGGGYTCKCATGYSGQNCLEGGSIKVSLSAGMRSQINLEENQQTLYNNGLRPLNNFKFLLKTEKGAQLLLLTEALAGTRVPHYNIYLDGFNGSSNAINHRFVYKWVLIQDVLSATEFRKFWVCWNETTVSVGGGDTVCSDPFNTFSEEPGLWDIKNITFETAYLEADWIFPIGLNECDVNPCDSDSICADGIFNYTCHTNSCKRYPCQNGGSCTNTVTGFTCSCLDGYSGTVCDVGGSIEVFESAEKTVQFERNKPELYSKGLRPLNNIKFSVKVEQDAHLLLQTSLTDFDTSGSNYVVYTGGWGGSRNIIMHNSTTLSRVDIPGILDATEYRKFWVSWNNKTISVGRGDTVGSDVFMNCTEEPKLMDIKGVSFGSAWYSKAHWKFLIALNECDVKPCESGKVCVDGIFNYTCISRESSYTSPCKMDFSSTGENIGNSVCMKESANLYTTVGYRFQ